MVSKVVASDQFKQVWINANRAAHRQVVGVLTGQGGTAPTSDTGAVKLLDRLTIVLPLLTLALFAAGIWLARDHRRALLGAGAGLALAMVVLAAGLSLGRSQFVQAVAGPNLPSTAAGFTFDTTVRFLRASLRTVFAVGWSSPSAP